jgi:hypothetical protein
VSSGFRLLRALSNRSCLGRKGQAPPMLRWLFSSLISSYSDQIVRLAIVYQRTKARAKAKVCSRPKIGHLGRSSMSVAAHSTGLAWASR